VDEADPRQHRVAGQAALQVALLVVGPRPLERDPGAEEQRQEREHLQVDDGPHERLGPQLRPGRRDEVRLLVDRDRVGERRQVRRQDEEHGQAAQHVERGEPLLLGDGPADHRSGV
jgi:hypothetical protein